MGTKTPPKKPAQDELPANDTFGCSAPLQGSAQRQLIGRIAEALQVPRAVLYSPPNAIGSAREAQGDDAADADLERECAALLGAYRRIQDPAERRRLLALVQGAAKRS